jgi:hypothetical protein
MLRFDCGTCASELSLKSLAKMTDQAWPRSEAQSGRSSLTLAPRAKSGSAPKTATSAKSIFSKQKLSSIFRSTSRSLALRMMPRTRLFGMGRRTLLSNVYTGLTIETTPFKMKKLRQSPTQSSKVSHPNVSSRSNIFLFF